MEKQGVIPDVAVEMTPADWVARHRHAVAQGGGRGGRGREGMEEGEIRRQSRRNGRDKPKSAPGAGRSDAANPASTSPGSSSAPRVSPIPGARPSGFIPMARD